MITDLTKVIALPKGIPLDNNVDYLCTCPKCTLRMSSTNQESAFFQEAIRNLEEMLANTSLTNHELSLQMVNPPIRIQHITFEQLDEHILRVAITDLMFAQFLLSLSKFISQFSKKYRHPLVCLLHDHNLRMIEYLSNHSSSQDHTQILSKYNAQLAFLRDQQDHLRGVFQENFIKERTITALFSKNLKAFDEIKFKAYLQISQFYSQTPQSDVPSNMILVKSHQKLA